MNNIITTAEEAKRLIGERRYKYFTFTVLGITISYRKPDMLQLALNGSLPATLADFVIEAYKIQMKGGDTSDLQDKGKNMEVTNDLLGQLHDRSYDLLASLCTSHSILNVPESDLDTGVISWKDVPEEDAMAFLMHIINAAQTTETVGGGEVSIEDLKTFPDGEQVSKRAAARKNSKNVRQVASA